MACLSTARDAPITACFPGLDTVVTDVMAEWHIPGLALALVRQDAPPLLQAFGFRDIESGMSVSNTTLFPVGSITKSFTSTRLPLLVAECKLYYLLPLPT